METDPRRTIIVVLALAVIVDLLTFQHPVGLGLGISGALFATAVWLSGRLLRFPSTATAKGLALLVTAVSWIPTVRASPVLTAFSLVALSLLGLWCARVLVYDDLRTWTVERYVGAAATTAFAAVFETPDFLAEGVTSRDPSSKLKRILVGLLMVVPVMAVFIALFAGADAVFSRFVSNLVDFDAGRLVLHMLAILLLAWAGLGLLRHARRVEPAPVRSRGMRRLTTETASALTALGALFAVFVLIQFAYLFGGLETNTGLTYAQYARKGFFELVIAAALVVLIALTVDRVVQAATRSRLVDTLLLVLIAETLVILASAITRLLAYVDAYGLTQARFYAAIFLAWTGVVLVLAAFLFPRSKRAGFALASLVAAVVLLFATAGVNPDGVIARTNLTKHPVDEVYLSSLSSDAVPSLVGRLDGSMLCEMTDRPGDWRSATLARNRARRALTATGLTCGH
jgi:hypothetical protein